MRTTTPPCHQSRNVAFHKGIDAPARSIRAAVKICQQCPLLKGCALDALTSGTTLDGSFKAPASGVVQAGIVCHGDQKTAQLLAQVAGVKPPTIRASVKRSAPPRACRACARRLHPWTRTPEDIPDGHVEHYGRGFCVHCRTAYQRDFEQYGRRREGLQKRTNRRRTHSTTKRVKVAQEVLLAAQVEGYDLTTREAAELAGVSPGTIRDRVQGGRLLKWSGEGVQGYRLWSADVAAEFGVAGPLTVDGVFIAPRLPDELGGIIEHLAEPVLKGVA